MELNNYSQFSFSAVVAAAGCSTRMDGTDKLFADLEGLPVLVRTLNVLASVEPICEIVLVVSEKNIPRVRDLLEKYSFSKLIKVIEGGETRQASVCAGVIAANGNFVVIHDGARPFVSSDLIKSLLNETQELDAVIPAIPVVDTIKRVDDRGMVRETIDRTGVFQVQTPQVFRKDTWLKAYKYILTNNQIVTDDASMLESAGFPVKVLPGSRLNIKITVPDDIKMGRMIINKSVQDG